MQANQGQNVIVLREQVCLQLCTRSSDMSDRKFYDYITYSCSAVRGQGLSHAEGVCGAMSTPMGPLGYSVLVIPRIHSSMIMIVMVASHSSQLPAIAAISSIFYYIIQYRIVTDCVGYNRFWASKLVAQAQQSKSQHAAVSWHNTR